MAMQQLIASSTQKYAFKGDNFDLITTLIVDDGDTAPMNPVYQWQWKSDVNGSWVDIMEGRDRTYPIRDAQLFPNDNMVFYRCSITNPATGQTVMSNELDLSESLSEMVAEVEQKSQYVRKGIINFTLRANPYLALGKVIGTGENITGKPVNGADAVLPATDYAINYQWYYKDLPIPGENHETLQLSGPFDVHHVGEYKVEVWGSDRTKNGDVSSVSDFGMFNLELIKDLPKSRQFGLGKPMYLKFDTKLNLVPFPVSPYLPKIETRHKWYQKRVGQLPLLLGDKVGPCYNDFEILPNWDLYKQGATEDENETTFACDVEVIQWMDTNKPTVVEELQSTDCNVFTGFYPYRLLKYVHPIPWRKTSFIYIGWWVFDEIVRMNEAGLDWANDFELSNYPIDLETLSAAVEIYGECIAMESRNGYCYNVSDFHFLTRRMIDENLLDRSEQPT